MEQEKIELDPIGSWSIEVSDNFKVAVITLLSVPSDGDETSREMTPLRPIGLEISVLRRLHQELGGLLQYMEKGFAGPTNRQ
ncbi:hypothetical protein HEP73_02137 [Xanthomonas sp. GW]|uniref:hypothetical protein n=1 Tax=Xanthomonas sp. GW TaxID=2724121 RepID=UPI00163977DB|nr:hypothetical protein [Xanthomonas sp. GW]QNH21225.1 hypothetical protein HEP73_02137 [Xanthomonas sp. GW]